MKRATNMPHSARPFAQPPRATGSLASRTVASIASTHGGVGLVYLAVDPEQSLNLNDSRPLALDYEVLQKDGSTGQQFASAVDERLTQWNLYAHVITGHNVADILAQIEEAAENLSELTFRRGRLGNWRSRSASCPKPRPCHGRHRHRSRRQRSGSAAHPRFGECAQLVSGPDA
ncbi:hypothetical protein [Nocardia asiatica]|uniref:hypothetical protein n=1 Tax=Nocardia asiatica TaxID=209252 RepID=UPI002458D897|nr:hypothetical protein [Nocardia asiatica]